MNGASSSEAVPTNLMKESKKPKYTKFTQQELPACKPLLTPGWVMATFLVVGIIFIPIGAVTLLASNQVVEIVHRYDLDCLPTLTTKTDRVNYIQNSSVDHTCNVTLTVPKKMKQPVYVYYELTNFYQNHRRYVKSRNDQQLRGDKVTSSLDPCKPLATTANGSAIIPCGLIAWSLFNDTYGFTSGTTGIQVVKTGIAWKSDIDSKFGSHVLPKFFPNNDPTGALGPIGGKALNSTVPLKQAEDLIVWMRTAALPNFRKLYGKIRQDLEENQTISVNIDNVYNTYSFKGSKKLVLSTTSWLGGKNSFLGIAYLTVGLICMFLALVFFLIHLKNPRPLGDTSYLSWNKRSLAERSRS